MSNANPTELGIVTGEAVALEVRPTSFVLRAAGALIDLVAEAALFLALIYGIVQLSRIAGADDAISRALVIVDVVVSFVLAPTLLETATRGRSLGKLAVGARVVRDDGGSIALRHAFVRALAGVVEIVFTLGSLAAIVGLLNRRAKRLGDLLAGTVSQHERVPNPPSNAIAVPPQLAEWASIADVARLPDPLARRVAAFLAQAPRMVPASRARLAAGLADEVAPFVAPAVETAPELLLAAVGAIRREREYRALTLEHERFADLEQSLTANPHGFPDR
ncbi:RDD family protein [Amnibacterium sp. CER49]|uniref:RDD family protein n=1 Tax=Amnibacterium sp. CER49 TaxID=3039161 RepID=UPI00244776DF|nr:RDD family protein [Amnibacterium sp. CER49]MDH2442968.1 RDD family protein [Amnibacterium sp. CER49]